MCSLVKVLVFRFAAVIGFSAFESMNIRLSVILRIAQRMFARWIMLNLARRSGVSVLSLFKFRIWREIACAVGAVRTVVRMPIR